MVLNGLGEFSPTAGIALIARFPEQDDINGRLASQTAVNLNVYLTSSTQPEPAYVVHMPERTADELFLMDGFQTYPPHLRPDQCDHRGAAAREQLRHSSSGSSGDGTTPPPDGFGGTTSGGTDARVDGLDAAVARYNAEKATATAWPDEQAILTAQPAAFTPATDVPLPVFDELQTPSQYRAGLSGAGPESFDVQSIQLAPAPGMPAGYDDVAAQEPQLFAAVRSAATQSSGDSGTPIDVGRFLGDNVDVDQEFNAILSSHSRPPSEGTPTSGTDPLTTLDPGSYLRSMPRGGGSLPGAANPGSLPPPGPGTFTLTGSITYTYELHAEDPNGVVLQDAQDSITYPINVDPNASLQYVTLPAFPWPEYIGPVLSPDFVGTFRAKETVSIDWTFHRSSDTSDTDLLSSSGTSLGDASLSASASITHTETDLTYHYDHSYNQSGTITFVEPTIDTPGVRTLQGTYDERENEDLTWNVVTTTHSGNYSDTLTNWVETSPSFTYHYYTQTVHGDNHWKAREDGSVNETTLVFPPDYVLPAVVTISTYDGTYEESDDGAQTVTGSGFIINHRYSENAVTSALLGVLAAGESSTSIARLTQNANENWHFKETGTSHYTLTTDSLGVFNGSSARLTGNYESSDNSSGTGTLRQVTTFSKSGGLLSQLRGFTLLDRTVTVTAKATENGTASRDRQGNGTTVTTAIAMRDGSYTDNKTERVDTRTLSSAGFLRTSEGFGLEAGVYVTRDNVLHTTRTNQNGTRKIEDTTDATGTHHKDDRTYGYEVWDDTDGSSRFREYYAFFNGTIDTNAQGSGITGDFTAGVARTSEDVTNTLRRHAKGSGWSKKKSDLTPASATAPASLHTTVDGERTGTYDSRDTSSTVSDSFMAGAFSRGNANVTGSTGSSSLPGSYVGAPPTTVAGSLGVTPGIGLEGAVWNGSFVGTEHDEETCTANSDGRRTDTVKSDVTITAANTTAPSSIGGVPIDGGDPTAAPPTAPTGSTTSVSSNGSATGWVTLETKEHGTSSLTKIGSSSEDYHELGYVLKGAATTNPGNPFSFNGSGSAYVGFFTMDRTGSGSTNYRESGGGSSNAKVTANTNGDTTVSSGSQWVGTYSLTQTSSDDNTYKENGAGHPQADKEYFRRRQVPPTHLAGGTETAHPY